MLEELRLHLAGFVEPRDPGQRRSSCRPTCLQNHYVARIVGEMILLYLDVKAESAECGWDSLAATGSVDEEDEIVRLQSANFRL